jgi:hypothetical protein
MPIASEVTSVGRWPIAGRLEKGRTPCPA